MIVLTSDSWVQIIPLSPVIIDTLVLPPMVDFDSLHIGVGPIEDDRLEDQYPSSSSSSSTD